MIMNDKIEEAAENYVNSIVNQRDNSDYSQDVKNENARFDDYDIQSAFQVGANWALQNQWHDVKNELRDGKAGMPIPLWVRVCKYKLVK